MSRPRPFVGRKQNASPRSNELGSSLPVRVPLFSVHEEVHRRANEKQEIRQEAEHMRPMFSQDIEQGRRCDSRERHQQHAVGPFIHAYGRPVRALPEQASCTFPSSRETWSCPPFSSAPIRPASTSPCRPSSGIWAVAEFRRRPLPGVQRPSALLPRPPGGARRADRPGLPGQGRKPQPRPQPEKHRPS